MCSVYQKDGIVKELALLMHELLRSINIHITVDRESFLSVYSVFSC